MASKLDVIIKTMCSWGDCRARARDAIRDRRHPYIGIRSDRADMGFYPLCEEHYRKARLTGEVIGQAEEILDGGSDG